MKKVTQAVKRIWLRNAFLALHHTKPWLFSGRPPTRGNFAACSQAWWPIGSTCTWTRVIANSLRFCQSLAFVQMAVPKLPKLVPNGSSQNKRGEFSKKWMSFDFGSHIIIIERWNRLWTFFLQFYITPEPQCHTIRNHIWNHIYVMHPFHWKLTWHRTWLGT